MNTSYKMSDSRCPFQDGDVVFRDEDGNVMIVKDTELSKIGHITEVIHYVPKQKVKPSSIEERVETKK